MKILGKHHDYYDWVAGYGVDESLVYLRKPESKSLSAEADSAFGFGLTPAETKGVMKRWGRSTGSRRPLSERKFRCWCGIYPNVATFSVLVKYSDSHPFTTFSVVPPREKDFSERSDDWWRRLGHPSFLAGRLSWGSRGWGYSYSACLTLDPIFQPLGITCGKAEDVFQSIQTFLRLDPPGEKEFSDRLKLAAHGFNDRSFKTASPGKKFRRRGKKRS